MTTKYITQHGIRTYNPAYHPAPSAPVAPQPSPNQATALPVISYPNQPDVLDEEIIVAPSYQLAVEQYNEIFVEAEIDVSGQSDSALDQLSAVLARYEVPAGMLSKLLALKEFDVAEIIVDDSGSMYAQTDAKGPKGQPMTRWQEAKQKIEEMMEIVAYVPAPVFYIRFLNRTNVLEFQRTAGESPQAYHQRVKAVLDPEFNHPPGGGTPALEAIQNSLNRYPQDQAVMRYFFGDGVPNGGSAACQQIAQLIKDRREPARNPFTFVSCTDQDSDVEWMKNCEELASYCSEFDDYQDESREIIKDQGKAFPYSYGMHLVGLIVAAFNPHDLDAMDESVPFTQQTLQDLLGYQVTPEEYKYYFDSFVEAQRLLPQPPAQRAFVGKLSSLYQEFVKASRAADIPEVAEYRNQTKQIQAVLRTVESQSVAQPCCVIV